MTQHSTIVAVATLAMIMSCVTEAVAQNASALEARQIPLFRIRARVTEMGGHEPPAQSVTFKFKVGNQTASTQGTEWGPWLDFTTAGGKTTPESSLKSARQDRPTIQKLLLQVSPAVNPTLVSAQVRFSEPAQTVDLQGDLFGPNLGIMVWRDASTGAPRAATLADYNQRYWHEFDATPLSVSERPKHFLIVDRFIGGDDDLRDWQEGISHLAQTGITAMLVPASAPLRSMLLKAGLQKIALGGGISGGPLGLGSSTADIQKWSSSFASKYFKADYQPADFSLFALADEPGWYYPSSLEDVDKNPELLETFRHYLAEQHLTPAMLGTTTWEQIHPIGHSKVSASAPLPTRRLFYWTCRFFPWYAADHMRQGTNELHHVFTPELKTFSNWNNFAGQFYFEGFPAHNPNPQSPDAAMAAPDWFESGRMHATDLVWTEDWFSNDRAYQWSFYSAKFRSIAYKNGLEFGGYIVGRSDGEPLDGFLQKVLALIGSGAKAVFYYNFGPEYTFPGNSYSEYPGATTQFARADKMIAAAEDVMWPGRQPSAQVAILQPRSAEVWDGLHIPPGSRILGVTNNNLNSQTLDYMAEIFDEYLALEMSNIPADFVGEDELTDGTLDKYKVLYITEPDIPTEGQQAIAQWIKSGGTLAMVPGAAQGDRYDELANNLASLAGSPSHQRAYMWSVLMLKQAEVIGNAPVFGAPPEPARVGKVISSFNDHTPAVFQNNVGRGHVIYFSYFPGLAFGRLALDLHSRLQYDAKADSLRNLVLTPVRLAGVSPLVQVNTPYVETPMLVSSAGAAITLLNWTGRDLASINVNVRTSLHVAKAVSMTHGTITLHREGDLVTFSIPLGAADIVKLTP